MWILFVLVLNGHNVEPITAAEFTDKAYCQAAIKTLKAELDSQIKGVCVWSGE